MFELFLRVQPTEKNEDPHNRLSKKFPGARISLWCNDHTDILEIESDGLDSFQEIQKELAYYSTHYKSKIIGKTLCQDKFQLIASTCRCGPDGRVTVAQHTGGAYPQGREQGRTRDGAVHDDVRPGAGVSLHEQD